MMMHFKPLERNLKFTILQIQDGGGSHGLVNSAMGQIPCSTERISCWQYFTLWNTRICYVICKQYFSQQHMDTKRAMSFENSDSIDKWSKFKLLDLQNGCITQRKRGGKFFNGLTDKSFLIIEPKTYLLFLLQLIDECKIIKIITITKTCFGCHLGWPSHRLQTFHRHPGLLDIIVAGFQFFTIVWSTVLVQKAE